MAHRSLCIAALLFGSTWGFGQTPRAAPSFDVASVKKSSPEAQGGGFRFEDGGRAIITNFTLKNLIMVAWHLRDFQVISGPAWLDSERFDIEARAEGNPDQEASRMMLRSLLIDRFGLEIRVEQKELPTYALLVAKKGLRLVANANDLECTPAIADFPPAPAPGGLPNCGFQQRLRRQEVGPPLTEVHGIGVTLSLFARVLSNELDRDVLDATNIAGTFTFDLQYADSRTLE